MIKLIALDLDNTLLSEDNTIPADVLSLLRRCIQHEITIVIATGRLFVFGSQICRRNKPCLQNIML